MLPRLTFVLGGAASGKSAWAENLLLSSRLELVYVATSRAFDDEINAKISLHRSRRGDQWHTIEADLDLSDALEGLTSTHGVLIDCATMWLTNQLMDARDVEAAKEQLLGALSKSAARIVVVSNEVGQGIVPVNDMARQFREEQGRLNIDLAQNADLAVQIVAGLPVVLRGKLP